MQLKPTHERSCLKKDSEAPTGIIILSLIVSGLVLCRLSLRSQVSLRLETVTP